MAGYGEAPQLVFEMPVSMKVNKLTIFIVIGFDGPIVQQIRLPICLQTDTSLATIAKVILGMGGPTCHVAPLSAVRRSCQLGLQVHGSVRCQGQPVRINVAFNKRRIFWNACIPFHASSDAESAHAIITWNMTNGLWRLEVEAPQLHPLCKT